ncbi:GNAT family N-acetyltransferase [Terrisporobacter mayombei]|uniref:N-acetyltransferase domain-containing protein n=1 Tax=Terrisporobacter mayombei TaxID=1541 RepID=A0ABY9Q1A6_9FIRM|nr:GNAT family N-acetyltransferase [Terrisporobacter mayombei]MCC3866759.1 GNAT family N-acetyltransferase [Terrisporobacter mayombei]WMT80996.1 hypothetical protein TEMA_13260 [Terrisporobacter mayombei]
MNDIFGYKISDSIYSQMKIIETPRFIFRPFEISDAEDVYEYLSKEIVVKYLPFNAHRDINSSKRFIQSYFINNYKKGKIGNHAIYYKKDYKVIGNVGFNNVNPKSKEGELGICINPKYWGNDFSTELALVTIISSFEFSKVDKLVVLIYEENKYSTSCVEKLNFTYIKTYKPKQNLLFCLRYELNRDEYLNMKKTFLPNFINNLYKSESEKSEKIKKSSDRNKSKKRRKK